MKKTTATKLTINFPARFEDMLFPGYCDEYKVTCARARRNGPIQVTGSRAALRKLIGDCTVADPRGYAQLMSRLEESK